MDNQILQTAILVLTIALLIITYKYQQQRNYIRDNVNKEEIPETNYPPINLEKFKIEKIKVQHTLTDIDYRHITEPQLRKRFADQLSKFIFENNIMEIERDFLHSERETTKMVSEMYIAVRINELGEHQYSKNKK